MEQLSRQVADEIARAAGGIDEAAVDRLCRMIADAGRVLVYGCGREALQIRGFAMRLYHLGIDAAVVGDMTTPPVGPGDLFLVTSGPGELSTVLALLGVAKKAGAQTAVLTANRQGSAAREGDFVLFIPAQTMASDQGPERKSILPMGSVYEGALFVLFEAMVLKLQKLTAASPEAMRARHTNLE
jgi:6-phospho-3-hexuloisomerase